MDLAGHIPQVEETIVFGNLTLIVEHMDGPRLEVIRVTERIAPELEEFNNRRENQV